MNKLNCSRFPNNIKFSQAKGETPVQRSDDFHWNGNRLVFFSEHFKIKVNFVEAVIKNIPKDEREVLKENYSLDLDDYSNFNDFANKLIDLNNTTSVRDSLAELDYPDILKHHPSKNRGSLFFAKKKNKIIESANRYLLELTTLCNTCNYQQINHEFKPCSAPFKRDYVELLVTFACCEGAISAFQLSFLEELVRAFGLDAGWFERIILKCLELDPYKKYGNIEAIVRKYDLENQDTKLILLADILKVNILQFSIEDDTDELDFINELGTKTQIKKLKEQIIKSL